MSPLTWKKLSSFTELAFEFTSPQTHGSILIFKRSYSQSSHLVNNLVCNEFGQALIIVFIYLFIGEFHSGHVE